MTMFKGIGKLIANVRRSGRRQRRGGICGRTGKNGAATSAGAVNLSSYRPVAEQLEDRRLLSVPNGPFGAAATATTTGVNVTWRDNSTDETGFKVERRTAGGSYQQIASVWPNNTNFWDATVAAGTQYTYRVHAFNGSGDSS